MKTFITPVESGGLPVYNTDLVDIVQNSSLFAMQGNYKALRQGAPEGAVVTGIVVSDAGALFNVTGGIVFLDGKFYTYAGSGGSIVNPSYIIPDTDATENRLFRDGASKAVITSRTAIDTTVKPVSGQYITINRAVSNHYAWHTFENKFSLANGWTTLGAVPLQYKKNLDGTISWRGRIAFSGTIANEVFIDFTTGEGEDLRPYNGNTDAFAVGTIAWYASPTVPKSITAGNSGGGGNTFNMQVKGVDGTTGFSGDIDIKYGTQDYV